MTKRLSTVLLIVLLAGCHSEPPAEGEVTGTVSYRNQPVTGGMITFVSDRGLNTTAVIGPDGRYQTRVPVGVMKVTVNNQMLQKGPTDATRLKTAVAEAPPDVKGTYRELPKKYRSPEQSGLSCTVQPGPQTFDVRM